MKQQRVTIFGAGGFLGRYVVGRLARQGATICAAVRDTEAAAHLKTLGNPGQITIKRADVTDAKLVEAAVQGADTVINLAGVIVFGGGFGLAGVGSSETLENGFTGPVETEASPPIRGRCGTRSRTESAARGPIRPPAAKKYRDKALMLLRL